MNERLVIPEILDSLPPHDAAAKRSRRDLRGINWLMGNYRWLRTRIAASGCEDWYEIGAGEGRISASASLDPESLNLVGVDFAPRPATWPVQWGWIQGDLFSAFGGELKKSGAGCAAVLFLHHFRNPELIRLGEIFNSRFDFLVIAEPARYRVFRFFSYALFPFVNRVTRHDMQVSIGAGFRPGELRGLLGLDRGWEVSETMNWLGGYRFEAVRNL